MNVRLYAGMYLWGSNAFGIVHEQKQSLLNLPPLSTNYSNLNPIVIGSWHNYAGELLGEGYLWGADIKRISREIDERDIFITVPDKLFLRDIDAKLHGLAYVLEYMQLVIVREKIYWVASEAMIGEGGSFAEQGCVIYPCHRGPIMADVRKRLESEK